MKCNPHATLDSETIGGLFYTFRTFDHDFNAFSRTSGVFAFMNDENGFIGDAELDQKIYNIQVKVNDGYHDSIVDYVASLGFDDPKQNNELCSLAFDYFSACDLWRSFVESSNPDQFGIKQTAKIAQAFNSIKIPLDHRICTLENKRKQLAKYLSPNEQELITQTIREMKIELDQHETSLALYDWPYGGCDPF